MTRTAAWLWVFIAVPLLFAPPAVRAGDKGATGVLAKPAGDELSRQDAIYRTKGDDVPEGYVTDRALPAYADMFSTGFVQALARLGPSERWLDIGAGSGQAILDYYRPLAARLPELARMIGVRPSWARASSVAISLEDRRRPAWSSVAADLDAGRIRYLAFRPLEEYSAGEIGRFQLMTDLLGGFTYTDDLSAYMERALSLLEVDGSFFTVLQDVKSEKGANPPFYAASPYTTELMTADGRELGVCAWLKRITCAEVSCELRTDWKPAVEVYRIRKSCGRVEVPALAKTAYSAGTPPDRQFRLRR
jgi:hypothetical protein